HAVAACALDAKAPCPDCLDLSQVGVERPDVMSRSAEQPRVDGAHGADADDGDLHAVGTASPAPAREKNRASMIVDGAGKATSECYSRSGTDSHAHWNQTGPGFATGADRCFAM